MLLAKSHGNPDHYSDEILIKRMDLPHPLTPGKMRSSDFDMTSTSASILLKFNRHKLNMKDQKLYSIRQDRERSGTEDCCGWF